jgi:hypothetical protein
MPAPLAVQGPSRRGLLAMVVERLLTPEPEA